MGLVQHARMTGRFSGDSMSGSVMMTFGAADGDTGVAASGVRGNGAERENDERRGGRPEHVSDS
jgi:hypothetical protein